MIFNIDLVMRRLLYISVLCILYSCGNPNITVEEVDGVKQYSATGIVTYKESTGIDLLMKDGEVLKFAHPDINPADVAYGQVGDTMTVTFVKVEKEDSVIRVSPLQ